LNGLDYTDAEIEKIVNDIYGGSISREVLPVGLYNDIRARLNKAVFEGFGGTYSDFNTSTEEGLIMAGFEKNIAVFSGAKTFQQVNDMSNFLYSNGQKIPFGEFKKYANEILETYNKNWLNTEYNTALSQAISGRKWSEAVGQKDIFPLLKYLTIGDERVRRSHKDLDEVVFEVGDKFWNNYFPPNDWNCRCTTEQLEEGEETTTDPTRTFEDNPDLFKMNAGKDKIIFREDVHPYLKVDKRYEVALGRNFDLPFVPQVKPAPAVKRKPRAPKVSPVPEVAPTIEKFVKISNVKEFKSKLIQVFTEKAGFNMSGGIRVSSKLTVESMNLRLEALEDLVDNYSFSDTLLKEEVSKMAFTSSDSAYGYIKSMTHRDRATRGYKGTSIYEMNFGHLSDSSGSRTFDPLAKLTRGKSRVDAINNEIATTVHEFAHVICTDRAEIITGSKGAEFIGKLRVLRNDYNSELFVSHGLTDKKELISLSLGKYASTNLNEFMAEAFTEYKLSSQPSKYAVKAGELIDEYFKIKK
jgi:SPP1 gp7 family putative phage head morphogenesis protein